MNLANQQGPLEEEVIKKGSRAKIAVIKIEGPIINTAGKNMFGGETETVITSRIREELMRAETDKSVKAVILKINSPGGAVTTCDIIRDEIMKFKKRTGVPVIAEMGDIAASGGVYLSTSADYIVAHPTTVTGSIGVITQTVNAKALLEKIGIKDETIKSGAKKDMGSPFRGFTEEERVLYTEVIMGMYERFIAVILEGRKGLDENKLREIADGRIFIAKKALEYGLIDFIGYSDDTIRIAEEKTGITNATIVCYKRSGQYIANIYSQSHVSNYGTVNLFNINASMLESMHGVSFMYMMQ